MGAAAVVAAEGEDLAELLRQRDARAAQGADVVVEAAGAPDDVGGRAARACARAASCNLFAGCPAGTTVAARRRSACTTRRSRSPSSFHHTPQSVREALRLIADGRRRRRRADHARSGRWTRVPEVLAEMARGSDDLKTAIVPPAPGSV